MKAPAFQFYAGDFLVGIMGFSDDEVGVYIKMLAIQWERGALPNDGKEIKSLVHSRKIPSRNVMEKFVVGGDGMLRNMRLEEEREKQQAFRDSRVKNAKKRWNGECTSNALASKVHEASTCKTHALQSPSPSSDNRTPSTREGVPKSSDEVKILSSKFPVTSTVPKKPDDGFCEWWFDEQEKCGWTDPRNGRPWHDWRAAFNAAWRSHYHRNQERGSRTQPPNHSQRAEAPKHDPTNTDF